jgi:flagellum-specific peptidoglycan hydrolase FlgJ
MTPMTPTAFLVAAKMAARVAGHIWPEYAAAEAALESGWGNSTLAVKANNLFGQKAGHTTKAYPSISLPTHEWVAGKLVPATAEWPMFPDWPTCFLERMNLLHALPVYALALQATTGDDYVRLVSAKWATDPQRAVKVLDIFLHHQDILGPQIQPKENPQT